MRRYLTPEEHESIRSMKRENTRLTYQEIADRFKVSRTAVWKTINGFSKKPQPRAERLYEPFHCRTAAPKPRPKIIGPRPSPLISWTPSLAQLTARR